MCLLVPLIYWFDAYDPRGWGDYATSWMNSFTENVVIILCASLFVFPICWVVTKRVIDSIALTLGQQALIFAGYFYLDQTADHFPESADGILSISGLVILFNAVGFLFFFIGLGIVYRVTKTFHYQLRPLTIPADLLDQRLISLARLMGLVCIVFIAEPMILTHSIPLLASEDTLSREDLIADSSSRALFQAAGAFLPFIVAILAVGMVRKPSRIFGWDGIIVGLMLLLQLLTASRLPIAIAVAVMLSAVTMHLKLPRWLLVISFMAYLSLFTLLSGFTSLLRLNPHALENGDWLANSVQEAYLGDNIIDLRDGSWVFSKWDFEPLMGRTYLGGALAMVPSGIFPEKKQFHLGMTGVRIVGIPEEEHFGLRITFFGEAFLNFGWAGVIVLGTLIGALYAVILRQIHLVAQPGTQSCLYRSITLLILLQCLLPLGNTSDGFILWAQVGLLFLMWLVVVYPLRRRLSTLTPSQSFPAHENEPRTSGA